MAIHAVSRVEWRSSPSRKVATISRAAYVKAGAQVDPVAGNNEGRFSQDRSGGREGNG